jgi:DNA-binding NarL/FixJ family response regulator
MQRSRATERWRTPPGPEGSNGNHPTGCLGPLSRSRAVAEVAYLVRDMLFTSKIREVAKQLGVTVQSARDPAGLAAAAADARLVIVDLRLPEAMEALAAVHGSRPGAARPRTVGFVDHERTDVMDAARAQGCTEVMAKGQFANSLAKMLSFPRGETP